jgi:hypothetical protein
VRHPHVQMWLLADLERESLNAAINIRPTRSRSEVSQNNIAFFHLAAFAFNSTPSL